MSAECLLTSSVHCRHVSKSYHLLSGQIRWYSYSYPYTIAIFIKFKCWLLNRTNLASRCFIMFCSGCEEETNWFTLNSVQKIFGRFIAEFLWKLNHYASFSFLLPDPFLLTWGSKKWKIDLFYCFVSNFTFATTGQIISFRHVPQPNLRLLPFIIFVPSSWPVFTQ